MKVKELIAELKNLPQGWVVDLQTSADLGMFFPLKKVIPSLDDELKIVTLYGEYEDEDEDA